MTREELVRTLMDSVYRYENEDAARVLARAKAEDAVDAAARALADMVSRSDRGEWVSGYGHALAAYDAAVAAAKEAR